MVHSPNRRQLFQGGNASESDHENDETEEYKLIAHKVPFKNSVEQDLPEEEKVDSYGDMEMQ